MPRKYNDLMSYLTESPNSAGRIEMGVPPSGVPERVVVLGAPKLPARLPLAPETGKKAAAATAGSGSAANAEEVMLELLNARYAAQEAARRAAYEDTAARQRAQYEASLAQVNTAADSALRQAYLNRMNSLRGLNQSLAARGLSGGATETALASVANQYGEARAQIEAERLAQQGQLAATLNSNLAAAYQSLQTGSLSDLADFTGDLTKFYASNDYAAASTADSTGAAQAVWYALARRHRRSGASDEEVAARLTSSGASRAVVEQIMAMLGQ